MNVNIQIEGGDQIAKMLSEFGPKYEKQVARKSLQKAAEPVLAKAKETCPADTGRLRDTLTKELRTKKGFAFVGIGAASISGKSFGKRIGKGLTGDAYYIKFVEFGTRYQKATHFLRNALESTTEEAVGIYAETSRAGVEQMDLKR